ncbi:MAG: hypothetical protein CMJ64_17975 [Planctomycetaceae bacterium]|nr:hypothetical protein [Planctomycetaceae bacterium]
MRRRIATEEDDVSLFPFLSIIAAVIGVLTLMIAAVTLGQMNQDDVKEAVENAIKMEHLRKELAEAEDVAEELTLQLDKEKAKLLDSANSRQNELVKSRAELETLMKQLAAAQKKTEEAKKVTIVIPKIPQGKRETVGDMQNQLASIKGRLAVLKKELDQKTKPPEEAQVSILPGGTGISFTPNFVECTASAIVLHTEEPPLTIRNAEVAANAKFVALLNKVANDKKQSIVFLLRSDSLGTYRMAKKLCDDNDVRNGKLPALGNGRLDFSQFRKK